MLLRPSDSRSDEQPEVTLETTVARVSFEQAALLQSPVAHVLMGETMEVFADEDEEAMRPTRACAFKQDASDDVTSAASVSWHCEERLKLAGMAQWMSANDRISSASIRRDRLTTEQWCQPTAPRRRRQRERSCGKRS